VSAVTGSESFPAAGALAEPTSDGGWTAGLAEPSWDGKSGDVGPDDDTAPLPVILPDQLPPEAAHPDDQDPADERVRGPFEPAERPAWQQATGSHEATELYGTATPGASSSAGPPTAASSSARSERTAGGPASPPAGTTSPGVGQVFSRAAARSPGSPASAPSAAAAKMNQIKDLYLTAEAIGDDALDKHFQLVSERQRQLIKEYFEQAVASRPEGKSPN
jgi:hypothetical protein